VSLLSLTNAEFDYGREKILAGVNLALHRDTRYALVGPNGAGKTTLLGVLHGELTLHGGQRAIAGGVTCRYLRQESVLGETDASVCAVRSAVRAVAFARELALQEELAEVARQLAQTAPAEQAALVARQGRLQTEFEHLDGYAIDVRLDAALRGVGLPEAVWENPLVRLSGGERRRAALAAALLGPCDLLLLDEPTNHLDRASREWLEGYLAERRGAAVIISHDRWFLDRVAQRTLHLDRGRLTDYGGNYSFYHKAAADRLRQEQAAWRRQQDHIRQTEAFIRKNLEGQKTKQAQARRKQLGKLDRLDRPPAERDSYRFRLRPQRESGGTVLHAERVAKSFGERSLFRDLDLLVVRGDRVGILGPNGCGKTTLLRILAGLEAPDAGRVVRGHNVDLGLYDQNLRTVSDHRTVLGEMQDVDPGALAGDLRTFLGAFGFGEDMIDRPVGSLSGGERGRLALLRLIKEGHNTLLLDEPTNHLDIRSRESLEEALHDYAGTLVMISHDRRFLDQLVQRLVVFPSGPGEQVRIFLGTYGDLARTQAEERRAAAEAAAIERPRPAPAAPQPPPGGAVRPALSKNERARRRAWIEEVEATIAALETEREAALTAMSTPECPIARRVELADRSVAIEAELAAALADWERWHTELAGEEA